MRGRSRADGQNMERSRLVQEVWKEGVGALRELESLDGSSRRVSGDGSSSWMPAKEGDLLCEEMFSSTYRRTENEFEGHPE